MEIEKELEHWLINAKDFSIELEELKKDNDALKDAFYKNLEFGTAGLRGILGAGSNRMNIYTVGQATQAIANYLNNSTKTPSVAIARDSRNMGRIFVDEICNILAANNIDAYYFEDVAPTPLLSFATRYLNCNIGINITASHNPAEYNGYKVYASDGCQITENTAKTILDECQSIDIFKDVLGMDGLKNSSKIHKIGPEVQDAFLNEVFEQSAYNETCDNLKITYTALNGSGFNCITKVLDKLGCKNTVFVKEQCDPDGNFPTCKYPNPETKEALQLGLDYCIKNDADLLLATDPDADRVGIAVKKNYSNTESSKSSDYVLLSGNEVGILLIDFLCTQLISKNIKIDHKVVITTIVSSAMIDALAKKYTFELRRVLTGFKYIGEQIALLESQNRKNDFLFGFEESYGYLAGTHARDKDSIVTSMLIIQMASCYKKRGVSLYEKLKELYEKLGFYLNKTISYSFPGASGNEIMQEILKGIRSTKENEIAGFKVLEKLDYKTQVQMPILPKSKDGENQILPSANVIEYKLDAENKIIIRPSGTEPK
ncbi:MAG: phospho-sugar mutase, partial [Coriobacteriales bacterium]|nr:phospho-sugar mutase [Coriobacteriales bacterium]